MTGKCTVCGKRRKVCERGEGWAICFPCWHARERGEFVEALKEVDAELEQERSR